MRALSKADYKRDLRALWVELVRLQRHVIARGSKVLVLFEGRDAAGKDGTIKRITAHLSPRETRVVALGRPSDRDRASWYFQRWVPHLPASGELVLFNRSWYNRAGVESVMGFCTDMERQEFLEEAPRFERMLARSGVQVLKYYLDIGRQEQARRLARRRRDPLSQWKISPIDAKALALWKPYSRARDEMLARTHTARAPWTIVRADDKKRARLEVIRDLLRRVKYEGAGAERRPPDRGIVRRYSKKLARGGFLHR